MWTIQRACKIEVLVLGVVTFFLGISATYFTMYYAGYSIDACRDRGSLVLTTDRVGHAHQWPLLPERFLPPGVDKDSYTGITLEYTP